MFWQTEINYTKLMHGKIVNILNGHAISYFVCRTHISRSVDVNNSFKHCQELYLHIKRQNTNGNLYQVIVVEWLSNCQSFRETKTKLYGQGNTTTCKCPFVGLTWCISMFFLILDEFRISLHFRKLCLKCSMAS